MIGINVKLRSFTTQGLSLVITDLAAGLSDVKSFWVGLPRFPIKQAPDQFTAKFTDGSLGQC